MSADQHAASKQILRWYHPTPGRLLFLLLPVEGVLLLLNWFEKTPKGWAVLISIACVGVGLLFLLGWFVLALLFRWRFQYSLRSLLVLMVVVAIPCSWFGIEFNKARVQRKTVKLAWAVCYDYQQDIDIEVYVASCDYLPFNTYPVESTWLWNLLGKDYFASVTLYETDIFNPLPWTDDDLVGLEGMPKLQRLRLDGTRITDHGLKHLVGLSNLTHLSLRDTEISDAGVEHLGRLKQLKSLDLWNTRITDAGLVHLEGLKQLKQLTLSRILLTDPVFLTEKYP
jgi:hypothetical protein